MILFPVKLLILVLSFMAAYVIRIYWINPRFLEPLCILDTKNCVKIEYFQKDNSVFAFVTPSAYRIWFNGTSFYVYDVASNTGRQCTDPLYQPAYEILPKRKMVQNYTCIRSINEVLKYYHDIPKKYLYVRAANRSTFSAYEVVQTLLDKRIIALPA